MFQLLFLLGAQGVWAAEVGDCATYLTVCPVMCHLQKAAAGLLLPYMGWLMLVYMHNSLSSFSTCCLSHRY
jgi:tryptophan-rich sensory protein